MRAILDIETNSGEDFAEVMKILKSIDFPSRKARVSLVSAANHFEDDRKLNVLTDGEIENFNNGICRAE